jgi:hypothetical protein
MVHAFPSTPGWTTTPPTPSPVSWKVATVNDAGELTKQGKRMHYMLGKIIFGQYWQALELPLAYNSSQLYVKSTDVNRTIESVQSHLAGMLENVTQLKLDDAQADLSKPFWNDET